MKESILHTIHHHSVPSVTHMYMTSHAAYLRWYLGGTTVICLEEQFNRDPSLLNRNRGVEYNNMFYLFINTFIFFAVITEKSRIVRKTKNYTEFTARSCSIKNKCRSIKDILFQRIASIYI